MDQFGGAPVRVPAWAVVVSLAVHGVFLAAPAWHTLRQPAPSVPLLATLRLPVTAPAPVPPITTPDTAPAAPPAPIASRDRARPTPRAEPVAAPVPDSPTLPPAQAEERPVAPEPAAPAPRADVPAEAAPPDAGAMARYARLLTELLARQQQYPRLAAQRGWEGEVQLRLQVARRGAIVAVQVLSSSGFDVLDQHALQLVRAAVLPPPPGGAADAGLTVDVPVRYTLKRA